MVGYMTVRPYVLFAAFIFAPLCSHAQSRVDTLLGDFTETWRDVWQEQVLADVANDFRVSVDGEALRVRSDRSASAIWRAVDYPGKEHLTLSWRWKIDRTIPNNTREREKAGDDFPARIFVVFDGTPFDSRSLAVCYVWASNEAVGETFINPHVKNVATVVLQSGDDRLGQWVDEERDVVQDFEALFGRSPNTVAGVAIMVDTDNTRTDAITWFDDIQAYVSGRSNDPL
jgi:hypothetical protein